jgi:hypothetical protein
MDWIDLTQDRDRWRALVDAQDKVSQSKHNNVQYYVDG